MRLPKTCVYAIQASLYLVLQRPARRYVPIGVIARDLKISPHFLTKVLQALTANHVLTSYRGPNGGVGLAAAPEDITLMQIIGAFDNGDIFDNCLLGLPGCGKLKPCPVHEYWEQMRMRLRQAFQATTLANMALNVENGTLRLASIDLVFSPLSREDNRKQPTSGRSKNRD
ncbi:MAG TPA: Rrf2 family transcriptional regulator [Candidatus Krumholzibacteria bacterium]|nr:Rrf2 family transcriptional regulator [Candidatus Krumholzibacteria bacterium]